MFSITDKVRRNVLVSSDHGSMIVNRFDCNHEQVGHGQWLMDHGSASSIEANHTFLSLRDNEQPVIFDIGANIGTYATWVAKCFPKGSIYCFEPQRLVFQMLCGNIAINNFDNVFTYNIAIGEADYMMLIDEPDYYQKEDFGIFSLVEDKIQSKSGRSYAVQVMSIDSFVATFKVPKVDFLKIDVEGMDLAVLKGAQQTLSLFKPVIFIEHSDNRKSILNEIVDYLGLDKYDYSVIGNNVLAKPRL